MVAVSVDLNGILSPADAAVRIERAYATHLQGNAARPAAAAARATRPPRTDRRRRALAQPLPHRTEEPLRAGSSTRWRPEVRPAFMNLHGAHRTLALPCSALAARLGLWGGLASSGRRADRSAGVDTAPALPTVRNSCPVPSALLRPLGKGTMLRESAVFRFAKGERLLRRSHSVVVPSRHCHLHRAHGVSRRGRAGQGETWDLSWHERGFDGSVDPGDAAALRSSRLALLRSHDEQIGQTPSAPATCGSRGPGSRAGRCNDPY